VRLMHNVNKLADGYRLTRQNPGSEPATAQIIPHRLTKQNGMKQPGPTKL